MLTEFFTTLLVADGGAPTGGMASQFLILIPLFGLMYFLIIRPQKNRQKQIQEMLNALKVGDKVMTNGGAIGVITKVSEQIVRVSFGERLEIDFVRSAIANVITDENSLKEAAENK